MIPNAFKAHYLMMKKHL